MLTETFYVDPRVEGCGSLSSRAQRLGFKTRGFLGEGVTVCVAASTNPAAGDGGASEDAATATAGAVGGARQLRGRRLSRIHRMAQTEFSAQPGRQTHTSIVDQARQLRATVVTGQAFRLWLGRQESKRGAGRGEGGRVPAAAGAAVAVEGKETADRPLMSRGGGGQQRAAGASRFKSREHPRVVIKDLDGLEPDRVQAFPPELLRKCFLHTDAPPGICPFTPREQASVRRRGAQLGSNSSNGVFVLLEEEWDREVLKMKKKDAQCVGAKVAARMPPAGSQKPRRGGWCECCEIQYIGTMSEHCASDRHTAAVEADPHFAALLAFESWTGAEGDSSVVRDTAPGRTAAYPTPKAEMAGRDSTAVSPALSPALPGPATKGEGHEEGGGEEPLLPPVAGSEVLQGCGEDNDQNPVALGTGSPPIGRRQGSAVSSSREGEREAPAATNEDSILEGGAISPSGLREATGGGGGGSARASRGSPRLRPKPDQPSGVALRSSEPGAPGECRPAPPRVKRGTCPPDWDSRKDHRKPGSPTADTPATSAASVPSSLTDCRSNQDSSSKSSVFPAESPVYDVQGPDMLPPLSASSSPTSTSSTPRTGRRRGTRGSRGENSSSVVGGASSSPPDAARRMDLRVGRGGTGGAPEAPGTWPSPPKGEQQRLTRPSPPREIGTSPSPASVTTSKQEQIDERKKKRRKRALALLEASAGWAASVREAAGPCPGDRTPRSLTTTSGGRPCRKVTKASPSSSRGSTAAQSQRVSKEKSPREDVGGGGGGSPSTSRTNGPSRENEEGEQPCGTDRSGVTVEAGSNAEARDGCGGSAAASVRRRCAPPPPPTTTQCPPSPAEDAHGRERMPKRARLPPDNGHTYGEEFENIPPSSDRTPPSGEKNSGGTSSSGRNRSSARQPQASSTASRMGLETAAAGQHSSPVSSEGTRSISRRLGSKFAENQTRSSNAASRARTNRVAVGATSKIEPPTSKRAQANATRPCTRSELPRPTRRNCLSSPGSFLTEFS
ncbi:unnamed protein product [Ectocarpus sp. CCAP 1310/34]|nr:unnamed protein product [Ectocarpus sp. CCAP 1310/34]